MTLFQLRWLRRLVRKYTNPIPVERAGTMKKRLAFVYMIVAWNAFGLVCYMIYSGKADWAKYYGLKSEEELNMTAAQSWLKTLKIDNAKVYRFSGMTKRDEFTYQDGNVIREKDDVKRENEGNVPT